MSALPNIGTFLRPHGALGSFRYTLKVRFHCSDGVRCVCERWGQSDRMPFDDGHRSHDHCVDLRYVRPGVWRNATPSGAEEYGPIYWLECAIPGQQADLFGGAA